MLARLLLLLLGPWCVSKAATAAAAEALGVGKAATAAAAEALGVSKAATAAAEALGVSKAATAAFVLALQSPGSPHSFHVMNDNILKSSVLNE